MKAFTLIEIMVVVAIMAVLMAAAIPSFNSFNKNQFLIQATKTAKSDIRTVQNFSISGAEGQVWGINFSIGSPDYYFFKCTSGTPNSSTTTSYGYDPGNSAAFPDCSLSKTQHLSPAVKFSAMTLNGVNKSNLAFESVTAAVYIDGASSSGLLQLTISNSDGSNPKLVCVSSSGGVKENLTGLVCT